MLGTKFGYKYNTQNSYFNKSSKEGTCLKIPAGPMDKAPAYGAGDWAFESPVGNLFFAILA